jgi:Tfp pilus assembly protein PilN
MKRVRIDFAPPSLRRTLFRTPRAGWALAYMAVILCLPLAFSANAYLKSERALEAELAARSAKVVAPSVVVAAPAKINISAPQAAAVNAAILQLNLPWRDLHDAVQGATPASVALLALEPDAKRRVLRITAEARSSDDMLAYVERLQDEAWITGVALTRHEINEQDPNRPIRFQLDAEWRQQ